MELGCNIGRDVITQTRESIHIVTWSGDPVCGIYRNQFNFTGKQCFANGKYGNIIEYSQADLNCPFDSIWLCLAIGSFGFIKIIKNRFI